MNPVIVSSPQLNHEGGKEVHWTEYGVGGGTCQTGNCVAETAADTSYYPFYGVFGPCAPARPARRVATPSFACRSRDHP
jgi:hypothetical protein